MTIRLGTRGSALALAQAKGVADRLTAATSEPVELVTIRTDGDQPGGAQLADKARFVSQLERALLDDRIDLAVHSAKDVPGTLPDELALVGVPERADPRDALCGAASLDALAAGAVVGTASTRRRAELLAIRPDLQVRELRGNVDSRLARLETGEVDALVLAQAGLDRLGRGDAGTAIAATRMTPAAGQGCLVLEGRSGDERAAAAAAALDAPDALVALTAERSLVARLGAGCDSPVGAYARLRGGELSVTGWAGRPDGTAWVADVQAGDPSAPAAVGTAVADRMIAAGAGELLGRATA